MTLRTKHTLRLALLAAVLSCMGVLAQSSSAHAATSETRVTASASFAAAGVTVSTAETRAPQPGNSTTYDGHAVGDLFAADATAGDGLIYLRTDATGGLDPYVGQTQSMSSFLARQAEHAAANPNADFDYEILSSGLSKGQLDQYEQFWINAYGGPTTLSNPIGGLSNLRNQMIFSRYLAAGGDPAELVP